MSVEGALLRLHARPHRLVHEDRAGNFRPVPRHSPELLVIVREALPVVRLPADLRHLDLLHRLVIRVKHGLAHPRHPELLLRPDPLQLATVAALLVAEGRPPVDGHF